MDSRLVQQSVPDISADAALAIAQRHYDLDGSLHALRSEQDKSFAIERSDGLQFVLRIANADAELATLDFQTRALQHVRRVDPSLPVPSVVASNDGAAISSADFGSGQQHYYYLLDYIQGEPLQDVDGGVDLRRYAELGLLLGRLDVALRGFFHPAAQRQHIWNIAACSRLQSLLQHLPDADSRRTVGDVLQRMHDVVAPRLARMRQQVIHQDAHAGNVLVDASGICGLIDFGDMLQGPLCAEIAAASDVPGNDHDVIEIMREVTFGFDSTLPLEEDEIETIFDMVAARHAMTATIAYARAALQPDAQAHISNPARHIETLQQLLGVGRARATQLLRRSCRFSVHCPSDPNGAWPQQDEDQLIAARKELLGEHSTHFYEVPLHFERGSGAFLFGTDGHRYLDCYNNVPQVGHCNTHVARAIARQAAALNTNTRYLYSSVVEYAERLTEKLAPHLDTCIFVNSGSEANDYAWQITTYATGEAGGLLMEDAYHGVTTVTREFSPGHPSRSLPPHLDGLLVPDPYRGPWRDDAADLVEQYVADAERAIRALSERGFGLAGFMIDSAFCSSGVPNVPDGYLRGVEERVRAAGGLMICDEVQSGFGRMGQWWGHEHHGVRADIVTMGKPVANGHPLGVVVTSRELMNRFIERVAPFSTFGGNTVACAAGNAVLDVIERDDLITRGNDVGDYLRKQLLELGQTQTLIGNVRGHGMLTGLEFVSNRETRTPATRETATLLELMREQHILVGSEGRDKNILKLRPPLVFEKSHVDTLVRGLDVCLTKIAQL